MIKKKADEEKLNELTAIITEAMQEKKADNIVVLDMRELSSRVTDRFIICHATNDRQVTAIAHHIEEEVEKKLNDKVWHREGYENGEWVLLDYVNIVAHIFLEEKREFYALEELWGDAQMLPVEETMENK